MEMAILGCNGTYPTAGRPASGFLVSHEGKCLWMDAGPGTFLSLCSLMDPFALTGVLISHRHPDHCTDLLALFHALAYGPQRHLPIPVICPPGLPEVISDFVDNSPSLQQVFSFVTLNQGDETNLGGMHISVARTNHPPPTIAYRITAGGKSLTYTADTGPSLQVEELAAESNLLVAEASLQEPRGEGSVSYHMTGREAGEMADRSQSARLMLTHIAPYLDPEKSILEAESVFSGPVTLAVPTTKVRI